MIRHVTADDASDICDIYNHYIEETIITFEEELLSDLDMANRIESHTDKYPWLVYTRDNVVLGYAYASEWKSRCAYRYSAEVTAYVHEDNPGGGIGSKLYEALIAEMRNNNFHSLIAAIALPNKASVGFHEKFGFKKAGQFTEVGRKFNTWIDVGYWELMLE